jgi:hypothetical protein
MSSFETMSDREYYSWGTSALAFAFGGWMVARPALSEHEWHEIDCALQASMTRTARCGWRVTIVLVAANAEDVARVVYVVNEGGPPTLDAVIALGHMDRSVSSCVDSRIARDYAVPLNALLGAARRALDRGSLADALRSIATAFGP